MLRVHIFFTLELPERVRVSGRYRVCSADALNAPAPGVASGRRTEHIAG